MIARALCLVLCLAACRKPSPDKATDGAVAQPACDLSSDDGIARQYHVLTGKELPAGHARCIQRSQGFPGLIYLGSFADDLGCEWFGMIYQCRYGNGDQLQTDVFRAGGWTQGDGALRRGLVMKWLNDGQGVGMLTTAPADFAKGKKPFSAPEVTSTADGGVKVVYWAQAPSGMRRGATYQHFEYALGPTAAVSTSTMTESFSVDAE